MYNPNFWNYGAKIITNYELRMLNDELNYSISRIFTRNSLKSSIGNVHTIFKDAHFQ